VIYLYLGSNGKLLDKLDTVGRCCDRRVVSPSGMACRMSSVLPIFFYLLFNGPLGDLRMYGTDLYQIFRIGTHMGGHDQSDSIR